MMLCIFDILFQKISFNIVTFKHIKILKILLIEKVMRENMKKSIIYLYSWW